MLHRLGQDRLLVCSGFYNGLVRIKDGNKMVMSVFGVLQA